MARTSIERAGGLFILFADGVPIGRFSSRHAAQRASALVREPVAPASNGAGCYRTKMAAAKAFLDYGPNLAVSQAWGGADLVSDGAEWDSVNEFVGDRPGQRRVRTLLEATMAAIPAKRRPPYCLTDIRLDLLNETAPGVDYGPFTFPADVAESIAAGHMAESVAEAQAQEQEPRHHGRPRSRRKPIVPRRRNGYIPKDAPRGPGYPLSGSECADEQGRIRPCSSARAIGPPERILYRPTLPDGSRGRVYIRPDDAAVGEERRSAADRARLRHAAAEEHDAAAEFPFGEE